LNGNRLLDGPEELGVFRSRQGGGGNIDVDDDINRPSSSEFSTHLEREILTGLSGRVSYVYKNVRDEWVEIDPARLATQTNVFNATDNGPDNTAGTGDDRIVPLTYSTLPQSRFFTNPTDPAYDSDFHTVEFAVNRRFAGGWMLLTSFGYTWLDQLHATTTGTGALDALAQGRTYNWRPNQRMFGDAGKETSTLWNYKAIGRYVFPWEIGFSGSWKLQSGRQWGRNQSITLPSEGAQSVRWEPVTTNRAPSVSIFDVRFDKSFTMGRYGRLSGMVDVFNVTNSGTVINFATTMGATYKSVIGILDPRIVRFGVRYDF
jgi:hypothetical protein